MRIYIKIFFLVLKFYIMRHPYLTAALAVWCIGSVCLGFTSSWRLCFAMILSFCILIAGCRKIWVFLEDFGSRKARTERKLRKDRERELLLQYLKEEMGRK